jgi:hypothetical protein
MAVSGGAGKALAFGIGVSLVAALIYGWRFSERRAHETGAEHEAQTELVRLASGIARCAAPDLKLPATSERVPARMVDVSAKAYGSQAGDFQGEAFQCAEFAARPPQRLQYRWVKDGSRNGRAEARADTDGDGLPDRWFEIRIDCSSDGCEAANYPHEVLADGTRVPPGLLGLLGRAKRTRGEPPSSSADDAPLAVMASGAAQAPPPPAPVIAAGAPVALDTLFLEAERRAASRMPGAGLLQLTLDATRGRVLIPAEGTTLTAFYGRADARGIVARGAEVLRVRFDAAGLQDAFEVAPQALHRVGFAECLPGQLLGFFLDATPRKLTLGWDAKRERALWLVEEKSAPQRSYGADRCAVVK